MERKYFHILQQNNYYDVYYLNQLDVYDSYNYLNILLYYFCNR